MNHGRAGACRASPRFRITFRPASFSPRRSLLRTETVASYRTLRQFDRLTRLRMVQPFRSARKRLPIS